MQKEPLGAGGVEAVDVDGSCGRKQGERHTMLQGQGKVARCERARARKLVLRRRILSRKEGAFVRRGEQIFLALDSFDTG